MTKTIPIDGPRGRGVLGKGRAIPAVLVASTILLAGCEEGFAPTSSAASGNDTVSRSTTLIERDVEAPEVFQVTEAGLWDGRPSLGGVWVAHPDVTEPERVIIRNSSNGQFVIGALFKREANLPGPKLQVSSDAASALAILAGAPVELNVTALRREAIEETAEETVTETVSETGAEPSPDVEPAVTETETLTVAAAAAIDEAPLEPTTSSAQSETVMAAEETVVVTETAEPEKKPLFGWFKKKPVEAAPEATLVAATAASVIPDEPAPVAPAAKPTPKKVSKIDKPYVQIGIFSVEDNANRTAKQMRGAGMVPTVFEQSSNGKTFWRVVVGPAQSKSERSALLKQIKSVGFTDAYPVTN